MTDTANGPNGAEVDAITQGVREEIRAAQAEIRALTTGELLARYQFARQAGITFGGERDEYEVLGYDRVITNKQYRDEYARGGIAGRIVDALPNATWRGSMELIEDEDPDKVTPFEQAWDDLDVRLQVQAKLQRVDKLAGLSTYAVLLIGAPGELDIELPKGEPEQLLYLTPFSGGGGPGGSPQSRTVSMDADASVFEFDLDTASPRFGSPQSYQLKRTDISSPILAKPVHWSRIIHVAENLLDDEVYGQPALERVWNLLIDLRKVTGGGSEAFWLRANQGLHADVDKDMATPDLAAVLVHLKEQSEEYKHQLTRWIRTKGVDVKTLGSDVANFSNPADAVLTQISGAKAIPKRILTGSEMGELASSQDRDNWKDQVNGRQTGYAGPYIVRPLVDRLIKYGYLPMPAKGARAYEVRWPQITTMTEQEKVAGAAGWASVNASQGDVVFTPSEIREKWADKAPLSDEQKKEIEEAAAKKVELAQGEEPEEEKFPRAAQSVDDEMLHILEAAIEANATDVIDQIVGVRHLGGPGSGNFGHAGRPGEIGGSAESAPDSGGSGGSKQWVSESGAVSGRKGENFVNKAFEPSSYGSYSKNFNDPKEASIVFEQTHAALEKRGYKLDTPTGLPFQYRREAALTHETGATAKLRKAFFSADPVSKAQGYKGSSRVSLAVKEKASG